MKPKNKSNHKTATLNNNINNTNNINSSNSNSINNNNNTNADHPPQTPLTKIKVSTNTPLIKKEKLTNTSNLAVNRELQKLTSLKGMLARFFLFLFVYLGYGRFGCSARLDLSSVGWRGFKLSF